jgi:hypothetical protein
MKQVNGQIGTPHYIFSYVLRGKNFYLSGFLSAEPFYLFLTFMFLYICIQTTVHLLAPQTYVQLHISDCPISGV